MLLCHLQIFSQLVSHNHPPNEYTNIFYAIASWVAIISWKICNCYASCLAFALSFLLSSFLFHFCLSCSSGHSFLFLRCAGLSNWRLPNSCLKEPQKRLSLFLSQTAYPQCAHTLGAPQCTAQTWTTFSHSLIHQILFSMSLPTLECWIFCLTIKHVHYSKLCRLSLSKKKSFQTK